MGRVRAGIFGVFVVAGLLAVAPPTTGATPPQGDVDPVAAHWTAARQKAAIPRDLLLDERGLAFRRGPHGTLVPHGHSAGQLYAAPAAQAKPTPAGKPTGGGEKVKPTITGLNPSSGGTIGASHTFSATVTDASGIQSVTFKLTLPSGATQSFAAVAGANNVWSATINGFTNGSWKWQVIAKDRAKPANTATGALTSFTVSGASGATGTTVTSSPWTGGGTVQKAAGRIYFEMPENSTLTAWAGYVCSGTVAEDATTGRSVVLTAAHCVYDDHHKAFARNVIFIPNQDGTTGSATDLNCSNDPMGCWTTSFGVVDVDWTLRTFPHNIPWDYGFYVVNDVGAHSGAAAPSNVLDVAAGDLAVQTAAAPTTGAYTHALGYSYNNDPSFMYCAQGLGTEGTYGGWWLSQCGLSGGSSGGPWMQSAGEGPIISVNSFGYTNQAGMGGPRLSGTSAGCVFGVAKSQSFATVTNRGIAVC